MKNRIRKTLRLFKVGDYLVTVLGLCLVIGSAKLFWHGHSAEKLIIRNGSKIEAVLDLAQKRVFKMQGHLGEISIEIANGKARFLQAPCKNKYCIHQGWIRLGGQTVICLPNRVSIEITGDRKAYDSLNY